MTMWLGELDTLIRYSLAEAVRPGPLPDGARGGLTAH